MKNIGFLSFGHWTPSPQSQTRSAADALRTCEWADADQWPKDRNPMRFTCPW